MTQTHRQNPSRQKLTADQVRAIRTYRSEGYTYARLAAEYGVSRDAIKDILTGRTYKWVD
jgi:predicted DNA-binding protein YlxM (UPF0122 family)